MKRILSVLLALCLLFAACSAFAEEDAAVFRIDGAYYFGGAAAQELSDSEALRTDMSVMGMLYALYGDNPDNTEDAAAFSALLREDFEGGKTVSVSVGSRGSAVVMVYENDEGALCTIAAIGGRLYVRYPAELPSVELTPADLDAYADSLDKKLADEALINYVGYPRFTALTADEYDKTLAEAFAALPPEPTPVPESEYILAPDETPAPEEKPEAEFIPAPAPADAPEQPDAPEETATPLALEPAFPPAEGPHIVEEPTKKPSLFARLFPSLFGAD